MNTEHTNNQTYTALTIGPIIKSLSQAHKTRELWAASYLFSFISESIINELLSNGLTEDDFVLPYPKARDLDSGQQFKRAGVFPDRIIIKYPQGFEKMQDAVKKLKDKVKDEFKKTTGKEDSIIAKYIDSYFRTNIIETDMAGGDKAIIKINKLLACAELQETLIPVDDLLFLGFLQKVNETNLYKSAFGNSRFPSIIEIATRGLGIDVGELITKVEDFIKQNPENKIDEDEQLWEEIKKNLKSKNRSGELKSAHKYIAIVTADGDNIGKLIEAIYENDAAKISAFSKALSKFSFDAVNEISKHDGEPVYAGGDDLLFFAPVVTAKDQNIFHLIEKIDEAFKRNINDNGELTDVLHKAEKQPSLSFGLSVTYYKYPMGEALNEAHRLLFEVAKHTGSKNNIAYTLQKHSGQMFTDVISKDPSNPFYGKFKEMLNDKQDRHISSLLYNLEEQKPILKKIADDNSRLTHFFDNFYDENIHKKNEPFIRKVQDLIYQTHRKEKDIEKTLKKVYSALRFVKFINTKNDE